uniref:Uncharacterized protein n=1 Tax=viral metagenome TaxID=1070528 RepID=A0A6C0EUH8_9ZZZZ
MNIFFLDLNPRKAAEYHCDKHVVKMIIETAQMLYSSHWVLSPDKLPENAYKLAHKNHPCSIWVRQSITNYMWLCSLGWWLCKEYQFRYGKVHKTEAHILWLFHNPPKLPFREMTLPAQAMPPEYKHKDVIQAYQTFYIESKCKIRDIVRYTYRPVPEFLVSHVHL